MSQKPLPFFLTRNEWIVVGVILTGAMVALYFWYAPTNYKECVEQAEVMRSKCTDKVFQARAASVRVNQKTTGQGGPISDTARTGRVNECTRQYAQAEQACRDRFPSR